MFCLFISRFLSHISRPYHTHTHTAIISNREKYWIVKISAVLNRIDNYIVYCTSWDRQWKSIKDDKYLQHNYIFIVKMEKSAKYKIIKNYYHAAWLYNRWVDNTRDLLFTSSSFLPRILLTTDALAPPPLVSGRSAQCPGSPN